MDSLPAPVQNIANVIGEDKMSRQLECASLLRSTKAEILLVPIVIVVPAAVTPSPILFLFPGRKLAKVSVFVAVVVAGPLVVVDNFIIVPNVVVAVVGVVDSVVMFGACRAH
jgi:hypothetical protein